MNARNLLYIQKYNTKSSKKFADDKLYTKTFLQSRSVGVAKTFHTIKNYGDLDHFNFQSLPNSFVIKPNHGYGGDGIIVVTDKTKTRFQTTSKDLLTREELYLHIASILDGKYALSGSKDQAIIEERLEAHSIFQSMLTVGGLPDIRIIVFNYVPVMAMLRVPTKDSGGKGNLQLGALGIGIDIATGKLTYGYKNGEFVSRLPNGERIAGIQIPEWEDILITASKIQQSTGIGYLGVDIVLSTTGIKVLEVNARPGLKIQNCNHAALKDRLDKVEEHKIMNPEQGVELSKRLFSQSYSDAVRSELDKPIIGLKEPITVYSDGVQIFYAKIDPHANENLIHPEVELEEGLLDVNIQGKRLKLPFKQAYFEEDYDAIIAGKYLQDFYIDVTVKNEIDTSEIEDIQEKMIMNVDKRIAAIDERMGMISYFRPQNLAEVKEAFFKHQNFNPQFTYKETPTELLDELRKELGKIPRHVDHPLMPLYEAKIRELELRMQLVEARDSNDLGKVSEKLFGKVDYTLYKAALNMIQKTKIQKDEGKKLKLVEVKKAVEGFLVEHKLDHWKIRITEGSASNMSVSKKGIVFIGKEIEITENHLHGLIAHEIETHVYRAENAKFQRYKLLQRGTANYLETEEGLAVFNQKNLGISLGEKEIWAPLRVVGAYMGKKMSFLELFHYLKDTFNINDNVAWTTCIKVKRGLKDTGKLTCFTKDVVYFTGLKKVEAFMKTAEKKDIELLYSGKISLDSLDTLRNVDIVKANFIASNLLAVFEEEE